MSRRPKVQGFTLVELLIAFALISLIALLLFSGLRLGMRAWEGVDALIARDAEQRITRNLIQRLLLQARPIRLTWEAKSVLLFSGDAEHLEFVAPLSEHVGIPGLYLLHFGLAEEGKGLLLTRWLLHPDVLAGTNEIPAWEPFEKGDQFQAFPEEDQDLAAGAFGTTRLVENPMSFEIAYFGPAEQALNPGAADDPTEGEWQEEWLDRKKPPYAVRIHLETTGSPWPDLIVRLPQPRKKTASRSRRKGLQAGPGTTPTTY